MTKKGHEYIISAVLGLYIIAAVAFECTANTAKISTIGIFLVFGIGLIYIVLSGQFQINLHCICLLLLLVYVYFMSMFNHNDRADTTAYYCLTCTVLCLLSYNLFIYTDRERITTVCILSFFLGALVLAIRVIDSHGGINAMLEFSSSGIKERRIGGELLNENTFGLYMATAFFSCLVLFEKLKKKRQLLSITPLLFSPFFVVMLLLSASKKAVLFLIIGIAIMGYFSFRKYQGSKKLLVLLIVLVGAVILYYMIMFMPVFRSVSLRFTDMFNHVSDNSMGSESDRNRDFMMAQGLQAFLDSPIFGNGTSYSYVLFNAYAHNNFVEILMNYGIVGFSLYYFPYLILLPRLVSLSRDGDLYSVFFLIFVAMQVGLGIAWVTYYERMTQLLTILAVGYSEMMTKKESTVLNVCKYIKR